MADGSIRTAALSANILVAIAAERAYQREKWGDEHDRGHAPGDWYGLIHERVFRWARDGESEGQSPDLRPLVVIAALAVAALENAIVDGLPIPCRSWTPKEAADDEAKAEA